MRGEMYCENGTASSSAEHVWISWKMHCACRSVSVGGAALSITLTKIATTSGRTPSSGRPPSRAPPPPGLPAAHVSSRSGVSDCAAAPHARKKAELQSAATRCMLSGV